MSLAVWIGTYVVVLACWMWIVRWGGADWIEGAFVADVFFFLSSRMDAEAIRLIGWIAIGVTTLWFAVGLFLPAARFWW